jgi:hypothetical protein
MVIPEIFDKSILYEKNMGPYRKYRLLIAFLHSHDGWIAATSKLVSRQVREMRVH